MATHSSMPAGRIPWTEEPGLCKSMVSQGVRHDEATNTRNRRETKDRSILPKPLGPAKSGGSISHEACVVPNCSRGALLSSK